MTDPAGASATATVHISVGNTPPVATITAPTEGAKYRAGVPVTLAGSGTDKEDGTLSDAKLSWHVILVHGDHAHDFITLNGKNASFTPATDHDADSHYRVTLTAIDSKGVSASKTVTIVPQTIDLTIASVPAGAPITYAGYPQVAGPYRTSGRDRVSHDRWRRGAVLPQRARVRVRGLVRRRRRSRTTSPSRHRTSS